MRTIWYTSKVYIIKKKNRIFGMNIIIIFLVNQNIIYLTSYFTQ